MRANDDLASRPVAAGRTACAQRPAVSCCADRVNLGSGRRGHIGMASRTTTPAATGYGCSCRRRTTTTTARVGLTRSTGDSSRGIHALIWTAAAKRCIATGGA